MPGIIATHVEFSSKVVCQLLISSDSSSTNYNRVDTERAMSYGFGLKNKTLAPMMDQQ